MPRSPDDLPDHDCIAIGGVASATERWTFGRRNSARKTVAIEPRLTVNTIDASVEAAVMGLGLARLLSYQADQLVAEGRLQPLLRAYEPEELPIHVVQPAGAYVPVKVRAFIDAIVPSLRRKFG
jgi:DNA-binding transcriptional LysR family regulator